jgi:hypothetical protein
VAGEAVTQERDELLRGLIRPVKILPDDDEGSLLSGPREHAPHPVEDPRPSELWVQLEGAGVAGIDG